MVYAFLRVYILMFYMLVYAGGLITLNIDSIFPFLKPWACDEVIRLGLVFEVMTSNDFFFNLKALAAFDVFELVFKRDVLDLQRTAVVVGIIIYLLIVIWQAVVPAKLRRKKICIVDLRVAD